MVMGLKIVAKRVNVERVIIESDSSGAANLVLGHAEDI